MDYHSGRSCDTTVFGRFFMGMLEQGICWPSCQVEAAFHSLAHSRRDISVTVEAERKVFRQIQDNAT